MTVRTWIPIAALAVTFGSPAAEVARAQTPADPRALEIARRSLDAVREGWALGRYDDATRVRAAVNVRGAGAQGVTANLVPVAERPLHSASRIEGRVGAAHCEQLEFIADVRLDDAEAACAIRPQSGNLKRCVRDVGHHRDEVAAAEFEVVIGLAIGEEPGKVAEVESHRQRAVDPVDLSAEAQARLEFVVVGQRGIVEGCSGRPVHPRVRHDHPVRGRVCRHARDEDDRQQDRAAMLTHATFAMVTHATL